MASRRSFLKASITACAGGIVVPAAFSETTAASYYKIVFDERLADACAFARSAAARGFSTAGIRGDITKLFFDDLDLRWKKGPVALAGYTTPQSLFCLDLLARDRGMRLNRCVSSPGAEATLRALDGVPLRQCAADLPSGDPLAPVFWIIQPHKLA